MGKVLLHELGKSLSFGRLSLRAKVLWPMLLAAADDQGRGIAESDAIKWYVCPNVAEITSDDVPVLLAEMVQQSMIIVYPDDAHDCQVFQCAHWWEYQELQWARPSRYSPPDSWMDRIRYSNRGQYYAENWEQSGGFATTMRRMPEPLAKLQPTPEEPPAPNQVENHLEDQVEPQVDFQPNLTQPNSTELNLTPSDPGADGGDGVSSDPEMVVVWEKTLTILQQERGNGYNHLFRDAELMELTENKAVIRVRDEEVRDLCRDRLQSLVSRSLVAALGFPVNVRMDLEFCVAETF